MKGPIVYVAGVSWDAVPGTDRNLVERLGRCAPVIWVDPPQSLLAARRADAVRRLVSFSEVGEGVRRLQVLGPPAMTRFGVRTVAWAWLFSRLRHALRGGAVPVALVLANPECVFPRGVAGRRLYYVTDDWVAGASLMGLSARRIARLQRRNARDADVVMTVSQHLSSHLQRRLSLGNAVVLPNGCDPALFADVAAARSRPGAASPPPLAGFVGQLNERIDVSMLEAVAGTGLEMLLVGPRTGREASWARRLDDLIARPNVTWVGQQPLTQLPAFLGRMTVGMTPYADTEFNRASFPLKTLEYLSAGLPVVSSATPSAQWLETDLVEVAPTAEEFARCVARQARSEPQEDDVIARVRFAEGHSWRSRAEDLAKLASGGVDGCLTESAEAARRSPLERQ